jgi:glycosyltransferase involved in cell wall biosynthesis
MGDARLVVAGYLAPEHQAYLDDITRKMREWGLAGEFEYRGELDRAQKIAFLQSLDVMSVPATYEEPKGIFLLEAMATGVPVVQPRRGAFPEILQATGGGLLVDADDPDALAEGLRAVWRDPAQSAALGAAGAAGVRKHYAVGQMAETVEEIYADVMRRHSSAVL